MFSDHIDKLLENNKVNSHNNLSVARHYLEASQNTVTFTRFEKFHHSETLELF